MADSPYGITVFQKLNNGNLPTQIFTNLSGIAPGAWMRYQLAWSQFENPQGTFAWGQIDWAISQCHAVGCNFLFVIQNLPTWYLSVDPATGIDHWPSTNAGYLPNAANFLAVVQTLLNRYYPGSPNGFVDGIQLGNEEWDSQTPRDIQSLWYAPLVPGAFSLIRSVYPTIPIMLAALRRTATNGLLHYQNWLTNLYRSLQTSVFVPSGIWGQDMHYYRGGASAGPDPKTSDSNTPDIGTAVTTILTTIGNLGYFPQLWIGETGWDVTHKNTDTYFSDTTPVTQDQQRQYTMDMCNIALAKGASKVIPYTDNTGCVWTNTTLPFSSGDATPTACVVATESKSISATIGGNYTLLPAYSSPTSTGYKEFAARNPSLPIKHGVLFAHA